MTLEKVNNEERGEGDGDKQWKGIKEEMKDKSQN